MAISKYQEDGRDYWKAYVHLRSSHNRTKRFQKAVFKIETEIKARREEKKLLQLAAKEVARFDGKGLCWGDVIHYWSIQKRSGLLGEITDLSLEGYISILNCWTKHWNNRLAADITIADGRELVNTLLKKGKSQRYIKKVKNLVDSVFKWAIEERAISGNPPLPCRNITLEKVESKPPEILSLEEIKKLLSTAQAMNHKWYPIWAMALLTGMRSGELQALRWDKVDLEKNIILVHVSYNPNEKNPDKQFGPTKGRYWRTVPIAQDLHDLLLDLKFSKNFDSDGFVLPRIREWKNGDQAVALRGFLKSINLKDVKFHALRSCWATQMLVNGVPAVIVMKIGGWTKMATMDIYVRLAGIEVKGATDCLKFTPSRLDYSKNVVSLKEFKSTQGSNRE
jgi:integrase